MSVLHRRQVLALGGAAAIVAGLPTSAPAKAARTAAKPCPTWIVGTPGEADHEVIRAWTREAALRFRADECEGEDDEDFAGPDGCECVPCMSRGGYMATRVEAWDGRRRDTITDADWVRAGFDGTCARCGDLANQAEDGRAVGDEAVCGVCMTVADWRQVDPEYAAERFGPPEPAPAPQPTETGV